MAGNIISYYFRSNGHGLQNVYDGFYLVGLPFIFYSAGSFSDGYRTCKWTRSEMG